MPTVTRREFRQAAGMAGMGWAAVTGIRTFDKAID